MNGYRFYTVASLLLLTALFTACQKSTPAPRKSPESMQKPKSSPNPTPALKNRS
ncbi:hypothetical protein [Gimesia maris]|uniref:hypothetical protein n=1 Tax=Gimesia maris TaxID=122 RepID=UPI0012D3874C|nr:hypothetical protein [Gimesia maris]